MQFNLKKNNKKLKGIMIRYRAVDYEYQIIIYLQSQYNLLNEALESGWIQLVNSLNNLLAVCGDAV